jgi:hypothetical protein
VRMDDAYDENNGARFGTNGRVKDVENDGF